MIQNCNIMLTKRESEVLTLAAKGLSNPEIAAQLKLSMHTVKSYIEKIYHKFGVHNKVQMVVLALKYNLIK